MSGAIPKFEPNLDLTVRYTHFHFIITSCNKACRDLCEACQYGHLDCVIYFISYNSDDINKNNYTDRCQLFIIYDKSYDIKEMASLAAADAAAGGSTSSSKLSTLL